MIKMRMAGVSDTAAGNDEYYQPSGIVNMLWTLHGYLNISSGAAHVFEEG